MTAGKWNADWKRRFFVLNGSDFEFYADDQQLKQKGVIDLTTATELKVLMIGTSSSQL